MIGNTASVGWNLTKGLREKYIDVYGLPDEEFVLPERPAEILKHPELQKNKFC